MTLSELIKNYREENRISQREFARHCGISHQTISILEQGYNSQTGTYPDPDLRTLRKLADGMGMNDYHELLNMLKTNNAPPLSLSNTERSIIIAYRQSDDSTKSAVCAVLHIPEEKNITDLVT